MRLKREKQSERPETYSGKKSSNERKKRVTDEERREKNDGEQH